MPTPALKTSGGAEASRADAELASLATFLDQAKSLVDADARNGRDYGGLITAFGRHIEEFQLRVSQAQDTGVWDGLQVEDHIEQPHATVSIWGDVRVELPHDTQEETVIRGPAKEDAFIVDGVVGSDLVAHVGIYDTLSRVIAKAELQVLQAFQLDKDEAEITRLGRPPKDIVREHIALLKHYNDMKDVGQQLIGVIADNRGVRVGSLYDDDEFGVGPDD